MQIEGLKDTGFKIDLGGSLTPVENTGVKVAEKTSTVQGTQIETNKVETFDVNIETVQQPTTSTNNSGSRLGTTEVPQDKSQFYTVTPYDNFYGRWNKGTGQEAVSLIWNNQGQNWNHGIATITTGGEMRYLVATTTVFGKSGDKINIKLKDGSTIKAIIADAKSASDPNWSTFGHKSGNQLNVLEWEVKNEYHVKYGNPTTDKYGLPWDSSSPVVSIENVGTIL